MGDPEAHEQPSVQARLQLVKNIARALNSANNAITLYPPESPMPREAAAGFVVALERFLMFEPYLQLSVSSNSLCLEGEDVCGTSSSVRRFAFHLHSRQVGQVRFLPGIDAEESVRFLRILSADAEALRAKGGLVKALGAGGVQHVKVVDLAQEAAAVSGSVAPDATEVAGVGALREEALISRDAGETRQWLTDAATGVTAAGFGGAEAGLELSKILSIEAERALSYDGAERELGLDNLTSAVTSLDDSSRRSLIGALMTSPDTASSALNALLSRLDESELVAALSDAAAGSGVKPIELLKESALDQQRRDRIAGKADALLRMSAQESAQAAAARRPAVPEPTAARPDESLPRYARKGDDVPFSATRLATDIRQFTKEERESLLAAPQEAAASDLDRPMSALLYLLNRSRETEASETIESILQTASYALELGQTSTVTRAICGLRVRLGDAEPGSDLGRSLEAALIRLSSGEIAQRIVGLLDGEGGESRLGDASAYFTNAQPAAQEVAVDMLGADTSGELKTRIQQLLRSLGPSAAGVLERHVTDKRWVVAHFAVGILGDMGEPRYVPALRRALSYHEPRVVESAMRALSKIGGRDAEEALVSAVEHGSEAARRLAIDLLGPMCSTYAVPALQRLATAGDLFGRGLDEKLAAARALGAIGNAPAVQALEEAAHTRFLFSPGKTRQFRASVRQLLAAAAGASAQGREGQ